MVLNDLFHFAKTFKLLDYHIFTQKHSALPRCMRFFMCLKVQTCKTKQKKYLRDIGCRCNYPKVCVFFICCRKSTLKVNIFSH